MIKRIRSGKVVETWHEDDGGRTKLKSTDGNFELVIQVIRMDDSHVGMSTKT